MLAIGGENLIDFVSVENNDDGLPSYTANPGGSPFNVAIAAGRQGQPVVYLTPISNDSLGNLLVSRLTKSGVSVAAPRVSNPTSLAIVSLSKGIPSYSFHRNNTAERQVSLLGLESYMPKETKVFHVGSLGLIDGKDAEVWEEFFKLCYQRGLLTTLDPNVRPSLISNRHSYTKRIFRMMRYSDIFKLSDEDLTYLYPDRPLIKAIEDCRSDYNGSLLIITSGAEGSTGFIGCSEVKVPASSVTKLSDTVGAGDTFMATILTCLIDSGRATREALVALPESVLSDVMSRASVAAAINCESFGCDPPWKQELDKESLP